MGALALSVGIGVQLGESAISEIDPVHFRGAPIHPRDRGAAVDPNEQPPLESTFAQAYGWTEGNAARLAESGIDYPYAPTPAAYHRVEPASLPQPLPAVELQPWQPGEVSSRPRVERYMDYPIEATPAEEEKPDPEWGPAEEEERVVYEE
jgi:hypothetical protein